MVTGAIAYRELKATNSAAVTKLVDLPKQHPDYPTWEAQISEPSLAAENAELYLFEMTAHCADDVRQTAYDHPTRHYVNLPIQVSRRGITGSLS